MAAGDTVITLVGNLVDDPELRFTPSGAAVAKFRMASTPRYLDKQTNEWKDGEACSSRCTSGARRPRTSPSRSSAACASIVQGRLKQRSYETKEGEKRTVYEVEVDEVGPSLRNASAKVTKTQRGGGGFGASGAGGGQRPLGVGRTGSRPGAGGRWRRRRVEHTRRQRRAAVLAPAQRRTTARHPRRRTQHDPCSLTIPAKRPGIH